MLVFLPKLFRKQGCYVYDLRFQGVYLQFDCVTHENGNVGKPVFS